MRNILLLIVAILMFGCGSGADSSSGGNATPSAVCKADPSPGVNGTTPPTITNFSITKQQAASNTKIRVIGSYSFSDPDADVVSYSVCSKDNRGFFVRERTVPIATELQLSLNGTGTVILKEVDTTLKETRQWFGLQLIDSRGNTSNLKVDKIDICEFGSSDEISPTFSNNFECIAPPAF